MCSVMLSFVLVLIHSGTGEIPLFLFLRLKDRSVWQNLFCLSRLWREDKVLNVLLSLSPLSLIDSFYLLMYFGLIYSNQPPSLTSRLFNHHILTLHSPPFRLPFLSFYFLLLTSLFLSLSLLPLIFSLFIKSSLTWQYSCSFISKKTRRGLLRISF